MGDKIFPVDSLTDFRIAIVSTIGVISAMPCRFTIDIVSPWAGLVIRKVLSQRTLLPKSKVPSCLRSEFCDGVAHQVEKRGRRVMRFAQKIPMPHSIVLIVPNVRIS